NQLSYTELTADHDGVVAALSGEVGQVAAAGSPMATVIQDGQREVEIYVPESRLASMAPGTPVTVTFWALHNEEAAGTVRYISPMADPATKTYKVRVSLTQMPQGAQLGMTAKVALIKKGTAALMIPRSALYEAAGKTGVWVVTDGRVFLHPVTLGSYEDDTVTITDGLTEGDRIVTGGINKLKEGMEVKVEGSDT
ncbi:efflux RND transporter periplasmic adaptor subunit, partial [uncultured Acidaminococcus sp.]|uniref:efflux RND transporter periplasmic adaptor subunit n=1 Tax=uncultured Acidaminococcus sp. TaxID=352152 RepID=UPI0025E460F5